MIKGIKKKQDQTKKLPGVVERANLVGVERNGVTNLEAVIGGIGSNVDKATANQNSQKKELYKTVGHSFAHFSNELKYKLYNFKGKMEEHAAQELETICIYIQKLSI